MSDHQEEKQKGMKQQVKLLNLLQSIQSNDFMLILNPNNISYTIHYKVFILKLNTINSGELHNKAVSLRV